MELENNELLDFVEIFFAIYLFTKHRYRYRDILQISYRYLIEIQKVL